MNKDKKELEILKNQKNKIIKEMKKEINKNNLKSCISLHLKFEKVMSKIHKILDI